MSSSWEQVIVKGTPPCGRYGHTASVVGRRTFIFGGFDGNSQLNDAHILTISEEKEDQVTYSWSQAQITGRAPCGRYGHTASVVGHNIFIFGGNAGTNMRLNDIHILNTEEMQWESPSVGGIPPCERSGHTASVVGNRIFIFGGYSYAGGEWLNDMYVFNTATLKWRKLTTSGALPSGRNYHTASVVGKKLYIFGGFGNNTWLSDMHIFNTEALTWSIPSGDKQGEAPAEHSDHVAFVVGKNVFIFGGYAAKRQLNDLHLFDTVKETWMRPVLNGVAPCGRNYHTACVVDNRVVIFGGYDGTKMLNDVHNLILDGIELMKKKHEIEMRFDAICKRLEQVLARAREELHDAFQEDIANQREQLAAERQAALKEMETLRSLVDKEKQALKRERKMIKEVRKGQRDRIKLNIGGHKFETSLSTVTKAHGSMLAAMFSGRHNVEPDEDSYYFIDRMATHLYTY